MTADQINIVVLKFGSSVLRNEDDLPLRRSSLGASHSDSLSAVLEMFPARCHLD